MTSACTTKPENLVGTFRSPRPGPGDEFGDPIVVASTGILVGAQGAGVLDGGAVYMLDGTTGEVLHTLSSPAKALHYSPTDAPVSYYEDLVLGFGQSIAVSDNKILVGAPCGIRHRRGIAFLFDRSTGETLRSLMNPMLSEKGEFGRSAAFIGNHAVVGAPGEDAVFVFDVSNGELLQTYHAPSGVNWFGAPLGVLVS